MYGLICIVLEILADRDSITIQIKIQMEYKNLLLLYLFGIARASLGI